MKNAKTLFLRSLLALLLCFSMLLGTTYAWFTDSVSSVDNIIKSGKLDIAMYWAETLSGEWKDVEDQENPDNQKIFNHDKWEPGYTEVRHVKIVNKGNLAFRYVLGIIPLGEVSILAEAIDVYFLDPAQELSNRADLPVEARVGTLADVISGRLPVMGKLEKAGDEAVVTLALKMREDAGNEYQNLSIGDSFTIQLIASQMAYESDSFGTDYDKVLTGGNAAGTYYSEAATVDVNDDGEVVGGFLLPSESKVASAEIPEGVKTTGGTLQLSVMPVEESQANITAGDGVNVVSIDVHVEGVDPSNTVPIKVSLAAYLPVGLNSGNYSLHHVENGQTVEMTPLAEGATPEHNNYTYDPATGDIVLYLKSFSEIVLENGESKWQGGVDYSWYDPAATRLYISSADQLAAFARLVGGMANTASGTQIYPRDSFAGKIVKLTCDINLNDTEEENGLLFYPIGYYNSDGTFERTNKPIESYFNPFEGVFDGGGHTISNFYQNTWDMKGDNSEYDLSLQYYRDGMGLFGKVYGGTVKNLTVDHFSSDGEYTTTGVIAAYADYGATFENIAITNCNPRVYNIGNGGIVGCVGWYAKATAANPVTFKNIAVDNTNKISALWGSWDVACGGIVGQYYPTSGQSSANYPKNRGIHFEDCHVAAQIDVYNDVCANYQYYAYRYAGILLGSVRENETIEGHVYPKMDGITAERCTVHFGTWNDYYYCELVANTTASYTHDHQMSRLVQVASVDVANKKVTLLGATEPIDIPTSGRVNYVVVKNTDPETGAWIHGDGHEYADCYHFVNGEQWLHEMAGYHNGENGEKFIDEDDDGIGDLKEDKQVIYREFNNLVTGYGWGVTSKGVGDMDGVSILDNTLAAFDDAASVEKFTGSNATINECQSITLGTLFQAVNADIPISHASVHVSVKGITAPTTVSATLIRDTADWTNSTLKFSGEGTVLVTIQDYYYCTPTTITLTVTKQHDAKTFIARVSKVDDPNGVGYELWGCTACQEAVKIDANHEEGHYFTDANGDGTFECKCGATAITDTPRILAASHDFTTANNLTFSWADYLVVENDKWVVSATSPKSFTGTGNIQPAIAAGNNDTIVQLMRSNVNDAGTLKTASMVYVSFELSYNMVDTTKDIAPAQFFSFRTTNKSPESGTSAHYHNEADVWAKMEDGVLYVSSHHMEDYPKKIRALTAGETYTITIVLDPEANAYQILLSGGGYNNENLLLNVSEGDAVAHNDSNSAWKPLQYELSDFLTAVFRSDAFSFVNKDYIGTPEYDSHVAGLKTSVGEILVDNVSFSCDTRKVTKQSTLTACKHKWTAAELAGETDLYRYTCSECGYYFTGVKFEVMDDATFSFASIDFNAPATQTHQNLTITSSNNNGHFQPVKDGPIENFNINRENNEVNYFSEGKLDITTNDYFYIAGRSVVVTDLNNPFNALMDGKHSGVDVDGNIVNTLVKTVEMSFKLSYTGDIKQLVNVYNGRGLVYYQTRDTKTGQDRTQFWLNFDKNPDGTDTGVLYLRDDKNTSEKVTIEAGKTYTITLRMELEPAANGNYIVSFVVNGNNESKQQLELTTSFGDFYQIILGRWQYSHQTSKEVTDENGKKTTEYENEYTNFHVYLDDLAVNYKGITLEKDSFNFASMNFYSESTQTHENLQITSSKSANAFSEENGTVTGPNINKKGEYFTNDGKWEITSNDNFYIVSPTVNEVRFNDSFAKLMNGRHEIKDASGKVTETNLVTAVEMTFDLSYTGDITQLAKTNLGLVYYNSKPGDGNTEFWLNFDKNNANSGALYLKGVTSQKAIINANTTYTVTLRMELKPAANGNYIVSFVVKDAGGNIVGSGRQELATSFSDLNQIIFGRSDYRPTNEDGSYKDFHIYFDNFKINYEGVALPN